jgi:hypothetical protein
MKKSKVWAFALLTFLLQTFLYSNNIIKDDFINFKALEIIDNISSELKDKTGINIYTISTNEKLPEKANLYEYVKSYDGNFSKPFVVLIFIPRSKRVGLIPSSEDLSKMYNASTVKSELIDVIASEDENKLEDKYNVGVVQGVSELADQIAQHHNIKLINIIPNDTQGVISIFRYIVYIGSLFVFWIFLIRPIILRRKNGK